MASIANDPGGRRRVLFVNPEGERKAIRLGKVSQRSAKVIKLRVEQLLEAILLNRPMEADLAQWVADLKPPMAKKLAGVGLIPNPKAKEAATLEAFVRILYFAAKRRLAPYPANLAANAAAVVGLFRREKAA